MNIFDIVIFFGFVYLMVLLLHFAAVLDSDVLNQLLYLWTWKFKYVNVPISVFVFRILIYLFILIIYIFLKLADRFNYGPSELRFEPILEGIFMIGIFLNLWFIGINIRDKE
jgi:hypothetical protein